MPNSVNPQSNSLHSQSHTQLTTLSCTTHNMLTTYPCLTTALASCQAVSSRVAVVVIGRRVDLPHYPFSRAFLPPHLTITLDLLYSLPYIWPPDSTLVSELSYLRPVFCFSYLFFCLLSCHFSALISFLVWSWVYFKIPNLI